MDFFKRRYDKILILFLFILGIFFRLYFYIQNSSLWFDEAGLAINFLTKSYKGLFGGLDYLQAAPVGFCLLEKFLLDILSPADDFFRDYILRLIPLLCGILSLFVFYNLIKKFFNDKIKVIFSFAIFALNMHAILYCSQCKQYSMELLISTALIAVFYEILQERDKLIYLIVIALSPWFSYSALFIIASGEIALFIKNKKKFILNLIPLLISLVAYYLVSIKFVLSQNYSGMDDIWITFKAFMDIHHPLRLLIRFGELFMLTKIIAILAALISFYALISFVFSKRELYLRVLFCTPIILVIIASIAHRYPVYSRLILFLLPIFAIVIADLSGKLNKCIKLSFILIIIYSLFNNSIYAKEMAYSYARDVINYLAKEIKADDFIIMDNDANEYYFYMHGKGINNRIYKMPVTCIKDNVEICRNYISLLPKGCYYFFSSHDNVMKSIEGAQIYELPFKPKYVKAVYFNNSSLEH